MAAIIALALVIPAASVGANAPSVPASGTGTATEATYQIVPLQNIYLRSDPSYSDNAIVLLKAGQIGTFVSKAAGFWIKVTFGSQTGYINSVSTGKILYIGTTTVNVNLRKGAGTSSSVITVLKKGTVVRVIGSTNAWLKVVANGRIGYVYRNYVKKAIVQTYPYAGVTTVNVYLREGPSTGYAAITVLKKGTTVTAESDRQRLAEGHSKWKNRICLQQLWCKSSGSTCCALQSCRNG
ncbi:SH3 domain-containing protein [Sporolactobacillus vineae]|uniref:SH3 domain-containing protein n=1 Tax=Sporolactobacillus vineae TaxID=444463 RepID=UPI000287FF7A|nr:SH3 domain-containing protein [Sporolactobacillus vineae]